MIFDNVKTIRFSIAGAFLTPNGICVLAGIGGAGLHPGSMGPHRRKFQSILRVALLGQKFVNMLRDN